MPVFRQEIQHQHSTESGEGAEEHHEFKDDGDIRGKAEQGLAADQVGIIDGIRPPLQQQGTRRAGPARGEHQPRQDRRPDAHGSLDPVDGKRAVRIPRTIARVADLGRGGQKRLGAAELGHQPGDHGAGFRVIGRRLLDHWSSRQHPFTRPAPPMANKGNRMAATHPWCPLACAWGNTALTSAMATMGR